jgi:adenine-specific DNA-methyltransferase
MSDAKPRGEPVARQSQPMTEMQMARLRGLFPEVWSEGKVDFERLRATLGDLVDDGPERYRFTWAGKRDAIRALQAPTAGALHPCREESLNWETTRHVFIEGENLEALKIMLRPYYGRVKMIYIDPPYNTGNDFVYPDDYSDPLRRYWQVTGQADAEGNLLTANPESSGRYHSRWLSMIYPRLFLARELLREDGVIFVSIDDHEVHNLRLLMNEVFGEENFVAQIVWKGRGGRQDSRYVAAIHEFIITYARNAANFSAGGMPKENEVFPKLDETTDKRYKSQLLRKWGANSRRQDRPNLYFSITAPDGSQLFPKLADGADGCWRWGAKRMAREITLGNVEFAQDNGIWVAYEKIWEPTEDEVRMKTLTTWLDDTGSTASGTKELQSLFMGTAPFTYPKPTSLVCRLAQIAGLDTEDGLAVDFFSGSATTAHAVLALNRQDGGNRRYILVQLPEPTGQADYATIAEIGKERIRRVAARLKAEQAGRLPLGGRETPEDLGMRVFKLGASSLRAWRGTEEAEAGAYTRQMAAFADGLAEGWRAEDALWELASREGYPLDSRVEAASEVEGQTVHRVTDLDRGASLYICLDERVRWEALRPLALDAETTLICRDAALDDVAAANLALQCRLKTV